MILVTGATGRLGSHVVRTLRRAKHETKALVRSGSEYFWLNDTGCHYHFGDLRDPTSLRRALRGCEYVIHAAFIRMERTDNHHAVTTLQGTRDLIEAAKKRKVKHFVMASCIGVGGDMPAASLDCLRQAEEALQASGLSYSILRFGTYAEDFAEIAWRVADKGHATVWASGKARVAPLFVRDAAVYAIAALDHPAARNRVLELVGPEALMVREAVEAACQAEGADPGKVRYIGGIQANLAARGIALLLGRRWRNHVAHWRAIWDTDRTPDISQVTQAFGIPTTPYREGIADLVAHRPLGMDPRDREEKVVHRQFQATVYTPGEVPYSSLPKGPVRMDELDELDA